jgi:hypothetical protein
MVTKAKAKAVQVQVRAVQVRAVQAALAVQALTIHVQTKTFTGKLARSDATLTQTKFGNTKK